MRILRWLSYVPRHKGADVLNTVLSSNDPVDRPVEYTPVENEPYDPRWLICGRGDGARGLFDQGSWDEMMASWAKSVVTGRARLGGIACGVIAVETRSVEVHLPADPANPDSEAKVLSQAGQVIPKAYLKVVILAGHTYHHLISESL